MPFKKGKPKTGGRKPGSKNKKTLVLERIYQRCMERGFHPADLLIDVMTDPKTPLATKIENAWRTVEYMEGKQPESRALTPAVPSESVAAAKETMKELEALSRPLEPKAQP